jgi:hypothetical protein
VPVDPLAAARAFVDWTRDIESAISEAQRTAAIIPNADAPRLAIFLLDSRSGRDTPRQSGKKPARLDASMRIVFTQILM